VGLRADLHTVVEKKISAPARYLTPLVQSLVTVLTELHFILK